jgi:hypothetical protein
MMTITMKLINRKEEKDMLIKVLKIAHPVWSLCFGLWFTLMAIGGREYDGRLHFHIEDWFGFICGCGCLASLFI